MSDRLINTAPNTLLCSVISLLRRNDGKTILIIPIPLICAETYSTVSCGGFVIEGDSEYQPSVFYYPIQTIDKYQTVLRCDTSISWTDYYLTSFARGLTLTFSNPR